MTPPPHGGQPQFPAQFPAQFPGQPSGPPYQGPPPGPHQGQHQAQHQAPGQLPPPGFIRVHASHNVWMSMVPPTITVDSMPVALFQGQQVVPVVPGNHLVAGHGQWMWQYGRAELPVHVQQGQTVDVHYKLPMITFMKGAIGFGPVKAPGKLALVLLLTAIIAIPVLLILVGVLAS